jgi:carboxypeptidase family protein
MSKTGLLTLFLLAVIATASLIFWPEPESSPLDVESDPTAPNSVVATPEAVANSSADLATPKPVSELRQELDPATSDESESKISILVLDRETQSSVARADVYILDPKEVKGTDALFEANGMAWLMHEYGQHYRTRANGEVRVARPSRGTMIFAEQGLRSGYQRVLILEDDSVKLEIMPMQPLEVEVIDSNGQRVADVPVIFGHESQGSFKELVTRHTSRIGKINFSDLFPLLASYTEIGPLMVELGIPVSMSHADDQQRTVLTDEILQRGKLTLTLPPVGQVRITVVDSLGKVLPMVGTIHLMPDEKVDGPRRIISRNRKTTNGTAEFRFIGLGAPLKAEYYLQGRGHPTSVTLYGPATTGAWAEANIVYSDRSFITGLVLDPEGHLLKNQSIQYDEKILLGGSAGSGYSSSRIPTDEQGRFRQELPNPSSERGIAKYLVTFTFEVEGFGKCSAEWEMPKDVPPGPYDLGEITLQPEPILSAGHIYSQAGTPIAHADVLLATHSSLETDPHRWNSRPRLSTTSDQTGAFQLQGLPPGATSFDLRISADGFDTLTQEITPYSTGLEFHLTKAARLQGSIQFNESLQPKGITIWLLNDTQAFRAEILPNPNASLLKFAIDCPSGIPHVLEIKTELGELIYQSGGLILPSGQTTRPPDLQPLDLRGRLHSFTIKVQNAQGRPASASIIIDGADSFSRPKNIKGEMTLLAIEPIPRIEIQAKRRATQVLTQVISDQIVVLKDGIAVDVQIPAELVRYKNCELKLGASLQGGASNHSMTDATGFDASGRASLFIPIEGEYLLWINASPTEKNFWDTTFLGRFPATILESGQVIPIALDPEAAKQKIDAMLEKNRAP